MDDFSISKRESNPCWILTLIFMCTMHRGQVNLKQKRLSQNSCIFTVPMACWCQEIPVRVGGMIHTTERSGFPHTHWFGETGFSSGFISHSNPLFGPMSGGFFKLLIETLPSFQHTRHCELRWAVSGFRFCKENLFVASVTECQCHLVTSEARLGHCPWHQPQPGNEVLHEKNEILKKKKKNLEKP